MSSRVIPYGGQSIGADDIQAVTKVLKSKWLTQGPNIERFEEAFARYCGAPYAVAVSSGTAGLHLSNLALGVRPGDEVLTTPMSFVATANSIIYCGGIPKFVDIEKRSLGIDPALIQDAITSKTAGILPVHFAGLPCRIGSRQRLSNRKDFFVLEDACHAVGAVEKIDSQWLKIGHCRKSDAAVFSFHPVKHITTGEGGMITTRRRDLYEKLRLLRSHGIVKDPHSMINARLSNYPWYYEMQQLGFNYRLTDIQCALGMSQLKKADGFAEKRRAIARFYDKAFRDYPFFQIPQTFPDRKSSYHLYVLQIDFNGLVISRNEFMKTLRSEGIGTQVHYIPIVHQPYYRRQLPVKADRFPVCEKYYSQALSIPIFPAMTHSDQRRVVHAILSLCLKRGWGVSSLLEPKKVIRYRANELMKKDKSSKDFLISGPRIFIRPLSARDYSDRYANWFNDQEVCRDNRHGEVRYTTQDMKNYVQSVIQCGTAAAFAIRLNSDKRHVGNVSVSDITWRNGTGEVSILIGDKSVWGKGIGTEACALLIQYLFVRLGFKRCRMGILTRNKAMIRVAKKIGFKEKEIRRGAFFKKGEYLDVAMFGLNKNEFKSC